jgi:hypothetical protein
MQWIWDCSYSSDCTFFGYTLISGNPGSSVTGGRDPHLWVPEDRTPVLGQELRIVRTLWNTLLNSVKALLMISPVCKHLLTVYFSSLNVLTCWEFRRVGSCQSLSQGHSFFEPRTASKAVMFLSCWNQLLSLQRMTPSPESTASASSLHQAFVTTSLSEL